MSISINEARKKIDILEEISKQPSLILTKLFDEDVNGLNFLYQINIDDKSIIDYSIDYLNKLPVFDNCILEQSGWDINVYMKSLKCGEYQQFQSEDKIFKINLNDKTYNNFDNCIQNYNNIMNNEYIYKKVELDLYWKKFINPTYKQRINYAIESFSSKKKPWIKLSDFIFWLFYPIKLSKKIKEKIEEEQEKINNQNEYNLRKHKENIKRKKLYLKKAPNHIENIENKQMEITKFLVSLGYKEDLDMSEYY